MRKISYCFLFLLVFFGCGDDQTELKSLVKDKIVENVPGKKITWKKDGQEMMLIPAGTFEMGDHFNEGHTDELPVHRVELDAFYMDTHEVTVGQFKQFVNQSGYVYKARWDFVAIPSPTDDHPMILVSWNDATAYAEWAGKRLPTEAEWEYAARGGLEGKRYSWGDDKIDDTKAHYTVGGVIGGPLLLVGSFAANGYGLHDMVGNVWEWCQDWYDDDYYTNSPVNNPQGPDSSSLRCRVIRGGSVYIDFISNTLRLADRDIKTPNDAEYYLGFRCVISYP